MSFRIPRRCNETRQVRKSVLSCSRVVLSSGGELDKYIAFVRGQVQYGDGLWQGGFSLVFISRMTFGVPSRCATSILSKVRRFALLTIGKRSSVREIRRSRSGLTIRCT